MLTPFDIYQLYKGCSTKYSDSYLYCLIDHAGLPGLVKKLDAESIKWVSLFAGSTEEEALSVAPILFVIKADNLSLKNPNVMQWICKNGAANSCVLLMTSPLSIQKLAGRLTMRLDAMLPDDMPIMLRFFDSRVFEELTAALSPEQKPIFLSTAHQWWFADRRGQLQKVDATFSEIDQFNSPLLLNAKQESTLIDASEPDQVAEMLINGTPNDYAQLALTDRYDFIVRHMTAARGIGIEPTHEIGLYCALALLHGEHFAAEPNWQNTLQQVKLGKLSLQEAAEQIEPDR